MIIPLAARFKVWVCDCLLTGSNPAGVMDVCLVSVACCQVEVPALD